MHNVAPLLETEANPWCDYPITRHFAPPSTLPGNPEWTPEARARSSGFVHEVVLGLDSEYTLLFAMAWVRDDWLPWMEVNLTGRYTCFSRMDPAVRDVLPRGLCGNAPPVQDGTTHIMLFETERDAILFKLFCLYGKPRPW